MMTRSGDTWYVVVTRDGTLPINHYLTIGDAADRIVKDRAFAKWKVLAQHGKAAGAPMRELSREERVVLEQKLYPTLFNQ